MIVSKTAMKNNIAVFQSSWQVHVHGFLYMCTRVCVCLKERKKKRALIQINLERERARESTFVFVLQCFSIGLVYLLDQRFSIPVLAPPARIFCMSRFANTPDSDNHLVRSALHAWTVFRLTCSLHRVHCSLLPEQGKSTEVYFISEH